MAAPRRHRCSAESRHAYVECVQLLSIASVVVRGVLNGGRAFGRYLETERGPGDHSVARARSAQRVFHPLYARAALLVDGRDLHGHGRVVPTMNRRLGRHVRGARRRSDVGSARLLAVCPEVFGDRDEVGNDEVEIRILRLVLPGLGVVGQRDERITARSARQPR